MSPPSCTPGPTGCRWNSAASAPPPSPAEPGVPFTGHRWRAALAVGPAGTRSQGARPQAPASHARTARDAPLTRRVGVVDGLGLVEVAVAVDDAVPARPLPQQVAGRLGAGEPLRAGRGAREPRREPELGLLVGEGPLGHAAELLAAEDPGPRAVGNPARGVDAGLVRRVRVDVAREALVGGIVDLRGDVGCLDLAAARAVPDGVPPVAVRRRPVVLDVEEDVAEAEEVPAQPGDGRLSLLLAPGRGLGRRAVVARIAAGAGREPVGRGAEAGAVMDEVVVGHVVVGLVPGEPAAGAGLPVPEGAELADVLAVA